MSAFLENCQKLICMHAFLQPMWKGPYNCWNFMESGSESAAYGTMNAHYHNISDVTLAALDLSSLPQPLPHPAATNY